MSVATDRVTIAFEGDGCGVGDLSWGQLDIWTNMVRFDSSMPMGGVKELPPGTTVDDIADELRYLMNRYQSLRTRLWFPANGRPRQVVSAAGDIHLEVVDAAGADPGAVAETVCERYRRRRPDYTRDWPIRMAVIRDLGVCSHLAVIASHLAMDGSGGLVMQREVAARVGEPVAGMAPLAQARWQSAPAGRRQNDAALRHWEGLLRSMPGLGRVTIPPARRPRHWTGVLRSPALSLATRALSHREREDSAPVLLAAFALALSRVTGTNPVAVRPMVSNRFRPGLADVVCPLAQVGLCVLDVADASFDQVLDRTRRASMAAYKHAYYNRADLDRMVARMVAERGPQCDIDCDFNDRRFTVGDDQTGDPPTARLIENARPLSEFRWIATQDDRSSRLSVKIDNVAGAIQVMIHVDSHFLAPPDAESLLHEMESVTVEAAVAIATQ